MKINIRKANKTDFNSISQLISEVYDLHCKNRPDIFKSVSSILDIDKYEKLLENDYNILWVGELEYSKKVVGCALFYIFDETHNQCFVPRKYIFIKYLCIDFQYRRNGIGTLFFDKIIKYAKQNDISNIEFGVWEFNKKALNFFNYIGIKTQNRKMELKL